MMKQPKTVLGGKYTLLEEISQGAFGTVSRGTNTQTGQVVAIKQVYKSSSRDRMDTTERELSIMKKLHHKNTCRLVDVQKKQFKLYLVIEHCPHDLSQLIKSCQYPINGMMVRHIMRELLTGVCYLHQEGIIHRDLKPSNILLDNQMRVKIGDFGSAVELKQKSRNGEFAVEGFTNWYKAPEMYMGDRRYDTEVDIWSVACVFAELLNGVPLFSGGGQIQQLARISDVLGSPDEEHWPNIVKLPDYGKIMFVKKHPVILSEYLQTWSQQEINFMGQMLKYQDRASAKQLLQHPYLQRKGHWDNKVTQKKKDKAEGYQFSYMRLL